MKSTSIAILIAVVLIGGALFAGLSLTRPSVETVASAENVTIVDGKQIITISAKAGYTPRKSVAQADIPTVIRFDTNGTFDCSSVVRIPSMNISQTLPQTGVTDIDLGNPKVALLQGTCGMGMYPFEIDFKG